MKTVEDDILKGIRESPFGVGMLEGSRDITLQLISYMQRKIEKGEIGADEIIGFTMALSFIEGVYQQQERIINEIIKTKIKH